MNRLQCFALIMFQNDREYWYELVTLREGELEARRSIFSPARGRQMADKLCDRHGITDRAGLYCGAIMRPVDANR